MTVGVAMGMMSNIAADQRFRADSGAHDRDDLGVEPILLEELSFFGDEDNDVAPCRRKARRRGFF